jgi:hypothetical protein
LLTDELAFLANLMLSMDKGTGSLDHMLHVVIMDFFMDDFGMLDGLPPTAFAANANDDNPNFGQTQKGSLKQ